MDVKDLRTEAALSERNNDGSKYTQGSVVALQCNRNKPYQEIGSNSLPKPEGTLVRPCAVIGPDRVVPPPASNDAFLKKGSVEPWPSADNMYRRPPDYPHRLSNQNPTRNISPRQTFQENMQRINVPPTYNAVRHSDSANYNHIQDRNVSLSKNVKPNMASEAKYCDVPYSVNTLANEPKNVREPEMYMPSVNQPLTRTAPHAWPSGGVNVNAPRTYSASEPYQYQQYPNCASQRPPVIPIPRPHRTIHEDPAYMYTDHYYPDAGARFKPFPHVKERFQQSRYEYVGNYPGQFHPPPPIQLPKYDIPKSGQSHPYPVYPHLKYLDNRVPEPTIEGYQRQASHQPHYNIPFRNQAIHPYAQVSGSTQQKVHAYPLEGSVKAVASSKLHYDNKMYIDYENARSKPHPMAENYFVNEMSRFHPVKNQMAMPNCSPLGMRAMPSQQYYIKENPQMRPFEYIPHFRNFEHHLNTNSVLRHAPQFSPNTLAISPTDSSASNDTSQTHGTSQEDCGYVSQSSTASVRSVDSSGYRLPHEYYKRPEYKYGPILGSSPTLAKSDLNSKDKQKQIDVRQFLSMWNEGEEENSESNSKEIIIQTGSSEPNNFAKHHANSEDQLYVLGLVNVPSEELSKYEHIEKISKLPENIKGYNNLELYSRFEEAMESCNTNTTKVIPKEYQMSSKEQPQIKQFVEPLPRSVSPLDVEAKISQSVIHKEVGCNFEIRPCTPQMLNVEVAAPAQNILGERVIEKVTNPLSKIIPPTNQSPKPSKSVENLNCHSIKAQEKAFTLSDNPSCKMTRSPYSSNNMEPVKANYTLQDLEINSGVCLASLPRLDNEIELNFPEVNQQFINANRGDCFSPANNSHNSSMQESSLLDWKNDKKDSEKCKLLVADSDKALNKLSKYRKLKANVSDDSASIENAVRTDSVIIKNPENIKNIEDKLLENTINLPMNLTSQSSQCHNSNENKDNEMALDFSLNKTASDLPIIEMEKDIPTKELESNDSPCETISQGELISPHNKILLLNDTMEKADEIVIDAIKTDHNLSCNRKNQEVENCYSSEINEAGKSNDASTSTAASVLNTDDNLLAENSDKRINDTDQLSITYGNNKKDLTKIEETCENVVNDNSGSLHKNFNTVEDKPMSNDKMGNKNWLGDLKNDIVLRTETKCVESAKQFFSPDCYNKSKQVENDFEHDEISANLEKLFESDEEIPIPNTDKYSSDVSDAKPSGISINEIKSCFLTKNSCHLSKELFSPWIQKLLIHSEGLCSFINSSPKSELTISCDNISLENEMTRQQIGADRIQAKNSTSINFKAQNVTECLVKENRTKLDFNTKKQATEDNTDTKKNNKFDVMTANILQTSTDSKFTIDARKQIKKRKLNRSHKLKITKSMLNSNSKRLTEACIEPQTKISQFEIDKEKSDGSIKRTEINKNGNENQSGDSKNYDYANINFKTDDVVQDNSKNPNYQNTSDSVADSLAVSKNKNSKQSNCHENNTGETSITENSCKIQGYRNTPDEEEQSPKKLPELISDFSTEHYHVKQFEAPITRINDAASLDDKIVNTMNIDVNNDNNFAKSCLETEEIENNLTRNSNNVTDLSLNPEETSPKDIIFNTKNLPKTFSDCILSQETDEHCTKLLSKTQNLELSESNNVANNCNSKKNSSENMEHQTEDKIKETKTKKISDVEYGTDNISKTLHSEDLFEYNDSSDDNQKINSVCVSESISQNQSIEKKIDKLFDSANVGLKRSILYDSSLDDKSTGCNIEDNTDFTEDNKLKTELLKLQNYKKYEPDVNDAQAGKNNRQDLDKLTNISDFDKNEIEENKTDQISILKDTKEICTDSIAENSPSEALEEKQNYTKIETGSRKESDKLHTIVSSKCNLNLYISDAVEGVCSEASVENSYNNISNHVIKSEEQKNVKEETFFSKNKSEGSFTEILPSECRINNSEVMLGNAAKEYYSGSDVESSVVVIDYKKPEEKNNKREPVSENKSDGEIDTDISSKCKIDKNDVLCNFSMDGHSGSIDESPHNVVFENYTESEEPKDKKNELGTELSEKVSDNDFSSLLLSNLSENESEQNKKALEYDQDGNLCDGISDKWIENCNEPNQHMFPTENDYILYDNSEENLCYPVVENNLGDIVNDTCVMPENCIQESPLKQRLTLKRSYSDSALNRFKNKETDRQLLDNTPMWPPKRQKIYEFDNSEQQIIGENICNFIQNNRRNSVSSSFNAENVSFCILIDNDCILTDETEDEKICFAEVSEDCITEASTLENNAEEIICCSDENELNLSDSVMMGYNDERSIQESWLDDVACVETVVSDDIVEENSNDVPSRDAKLLDYDESGIFNSDVSELNNGFNYANEEMTPQNNSQIENTRRSSCDKKVRFGEELPDMDDSDIFCGGKSLENILPVSYRKECSRSISNYTKSMCLPDNATKSELPEDKENIFDSSIKLQNFENYSSHSGNRDNIETNFSTDISEHKTNAEAMEQVEVKHLPESSIGNVFDYKKEEDDTIYSPTSSSPEVSSTTSEEKSSSILLKITNYNGSRISEINEVNRNRPRCKFTESKDYSNSQDHFPKRPLMTKAARKYIPPLKESIRDLKVKLPLPQQKLLKLKELKLEKSEPKVVKPNTVTGLKKLKPKPNFEDVLKSIDEVQIKMHKEKNKKTRNFVPKVVIKKNMNGSHYTSSCSKQTFNPDLTGRKWQPWVFLEKNRFIDNMAIRNKTKAIFSHRKNTYVLAEKFKKYKSASNCSAKFVISQPNVGDSSKGQLKYTIRLKHLY